MPKPVIIITRKQAFKLNLYLDRVLVSYLEFNTLEEALEAKKAWSNFLGE